VSKAFNLQDLTLRLREGDDVAVAKRPLAAGTTLSGEGLTFTLERDIPAGHKVALRAVPDGMPVRKYGQIIGFARGQIRPGDQVHLHNLAMRDFQRDYQFGADARPVAYHPAERMRFFQGYARPGGRVGTRNYVAVISTVNCSASVSRSVCDRFRDTEVRREFPAVDGVIAFTHKGGCGVEPGEPLQVLQRVLAGLARHPNIGGYVMIGLGCEVNQLDGLRAAARLDHLVPGEQAPVFLNIQQAGGLRRTVDTAAAGVTALLAKVNNVRRTSQPISRLTLALQCGGSDAHSGITANPALGVASDELVRYGGTSVLAETPEIYGAEHLLTRRAVSREVGDRLLARIRWWEHHVQLHGATLDNNPAPGNKAGGLTTIYEKSLGAVAKGGQSPLAAVYEYAEPITTTGFCFMDTPGFDPVSMTGLVSGGCTIGVFTTGRGSVYGCKPAPCLKVSTNTALFRSLPEDIDLDAGTILDGTETVEQVGSRILEEMIAVASGKRTKSELAGVGDEEFAPWMLGPTF
jgi:altronate hydrolase